MVTDNTIYGTVNTIFLTSEFAKSNNNKIKASKHPAFIVEIKIPSVSKHYPVPGDNAFSGSVWQFEIFEQ